MRRQWLLPIGAVLLALLPSLPVPPVGANGTAVKVVLSYQPDISNFGPATATGVAEVLMKEGEIKITALGLQPLTTQTYQFWLLNTRTGEVFNGGRVSPNEHGVANATNVLPDEIPDRRYDLAFLSVEEPDIVARTPNARRSIAGRMTDSVAPGELPRQLPNTGDAPLAGGLSFVPVGVGADAPRGGGVAWPAGLALVLAASLGFWAGRKTRFLGGTQ